MRLWIHIVSFVLSATPPTTQPVSSRHKEPVAKPDLGQAIVLAPLVDTADSEDPRAFDNWKLANRWWSHALTSLDRLDECVNGPFKTAISFDVPANLASVREGIVFLKRLSDTGGAPPLPTRVVDKPPSFDVLMSKRKLCDELKDLAASRKSDDPRAWAAKHVTPQDPAERKAVALTDFECWLKSISNLKTLLDILHDIEQEKALGPVEAELLRKRIGEVKTLITKFEIPGRTPQTADPAT